MQRIILVSNFFIFISNSRAQDSIQAGEWQWKYQDKHQTILNIQDVDITSIVFNYCSIFYDGKKVDCNLDVSFKLNKVNSHVYEGNFQSAFNNKNIDLRIKFNSDFTEFETEIFSQLNGEHYFPDNVIFKKN